MEFRSAFSWLLPVTFLNLLVAVGCGSSAANSAPVNTPPPSNNKTLSSITLIPVNVSLNVNAAQQFTVTGTYSDGSRADVTSSATWASSNAAVATVSASGLLNAIAPGTATATASVGTAGATTSVTVDTSPKNLTSITITPSQLSIPQGVTQQLTATGNYSDDTQADLTGTVVWNSSNGKVATINSAGALYAAGSGAATITASANSIAANLGIVVTGTGTNVATWHYDNERTGLNPNETTLTPANVNATNFGKMFSYLVDGYIYAQPLYVSNLTIGGASHNVVFAATENDSVYAFDADQYGTGSPLWHSSLLKAGETPQTGASITPFQGVTSTPVIDLASNTLYVVSSQQAASSAFFRLHALDLITGAEKFGGPVVITASVPGTNSDAMNGVVSLTTSCVQRAALLLADSSVFIGFGGCHSGWLLAYDAQTLTQTGVFNMSPNINGEGTFGGAGGVWMGGGGPAADSSGNIYVTTGNGPYDGLTSFGDSVMKFNAQLKLLDHFTPDDFAFLECKDEDLAAGGLLLLPGASEALVGGKTGKMYLVNTGNLGGEQANDAGATQWLWFEQDLSAPYSATCTDNTGNVLTDNINSYQIFGTAAFFNGSAYLGITPSLTTVRGPVRQFIYTSGKLTAGAVTPDSIAPGSYGTTPFISANGSGNGIVWVLDHGLPIQSSSTVAATSAILRAYDASDLTDELYNSAQNASDAAGLGIKFTSPIVSNGKVFIGTGHDPASTTNPRGELDVYGLK